MITFEKVIKEYNGGQKSYRALDGINFEIKDGEFVSIIGPSGAGKSTLLKMLIREETPTKGQVTVDDINVPALSDSEVPYLRRKIGTIFQDFKLLSNKTAFENVAFAMEVIGASQKEIEYDVPKVLRIVGMEERGGNFPHQLSGGEKQRIAIARALVHRPKILLADEPTGNLDLLNTFDVIKLLMKINEFGTTVVLASHDREVVNAVGQRVITMDKGKIVKDQEQGKYSI
ncbi:MAG: cell division transport system ATP-binding protein [Parcubacteria group bacterium Gr01-1014_2]|nr:MAG: cell division transport system ATP-binding protein [Parcubacteria group bacterium Gr01-1014_2]